MNNAKLRIILAAASVAIAGVVVFFVWNHMRQQTINQAQAVISNAPKVKDVPGAGNPSNQYVKAQNIQNSVEAQKARDNASSFVPSISEAGFVGSPSYFAEQGAKEDNTTPVGDKRCPLNKVVYMFRPNPASCSVDNLRLARNAGVTAEELRCQACSCPAIKAAGFTAGELKVTGYSAKDLRDCGYNLNQLRNAGFNATDLKNAGFSATALRNAGFTAAQLHDAGFTPTQLIQAGFPPSQLEAAGIALPENCDPQYLKAEKEQGLSAATLRAQGCGLTALKAAGFSAKQLENAGFSAAELQAAGMTLSSPKQCDPAALKRAHMNGASAVELSKGGCGLAALKAAGFSANELKNAGFSAAQLKDAGFSAKQLHDAGFSAKELKAAGFTAKQLKDAGYTPMELKQAGFTAAQLKNAGFNAAQLKNAGFNAKQLKDAGFSAKQLNDAGFTAAQLKQAGFTAGQLHDAGFSATQLKDAGFSAKQLRNAGYSAADLKKAGFTPTQLLAAGYTKGDLLRAGFSPKNAGFNPVVAQQPNAVIAQSATPAATSNMPSIADNENSQAAELNRLQAMQQAAMNQQQKEDSLQMMQGQMSMEAQKLMGGWSNPKSQTYQAGIETQQNNLNGESNVGTSGPTLKAGSILFATLDTSVDSDNNSPIMATIITGNFKGAKLLGSFTRIDKKLLLKFNVINIPALPKSVSLNAVAIDPNTARTALATSVNNHYVLRYGSLFASAFVEGLADGIVQSGSTQTCAVAGIFGCTTTYQNLNTGQYVAMGLGKAGQQYSSVMASNFNTPPTVRIAGGTGVGILLMQDLTLPQALPKQNLAIDQLNSGDN